MGKLGPFEKILGGMMSPRYIRIRALTTQVLTGLTCNNTDINIIQHFTQFDANLFMLARLGNYTGILLD